MNQPEVVTLSGFPTLPKMYVHAAGAAARARLRKRTELTGLPQVIHEINQVDVDLETVASYQRVLHGTVRDTAPSTYLHTLSFPVSMSVLTREDFPLPLLGLVHLENTVEHFRPVALGSRVTIRSYAENLAGHRVGTTVDVVAEVLSEDRRELMWRGVSRYLARGVFLTGVDKSGAAGREKTARPDFVQPVPTGQWRLGVDTGRVYAAVSGDYNPIHLSSLSAKALGMKSAIAHGMYLVARAMEQSGHGSDAGTRWYVVFETPTYLPTVVSVSIRDETHGQDWTATTFQGWNARTNRPHFSGFVAPLGLHED